MHLMINNYLSLRFWKKRCSDFFRAIGNRSAHATETEKEFCIRPIYVFIDGHFRHLPSSSLSSNPFPLISAIFIIASAYSEVETIRNCSWLFYGNGREKTNWPYCAQDRKRRRCRCKRSLMAPLQNRSFVRTDRTDSEQEATAEVESVFSRRRRSRSAGVADSSWRWRSAWRLKPTKRNPKLLWRKREEKRGTGWDGMGWDRIGYLGRRSFDPWRGIVSSPSQRNRIPRHLSTSLFRLLYLRCRLSCLPLLFEAVVLLNTE